jgi:hypothetical protein
VPDTADSTVAVTLSPTVFVFVQMRDEAFVVSVVPAAIDPTAPPPAAPGFAPGFVVTVFPLAVVTGFGGSGAGSDGRGAEVLGRVAGRVGVRDGAEAAGFVAGVGATSLSCGCVVVSRFANARSRFNALSALSAKLSGPFFASELHAPSKATATSAKGATKRLVYFVMGNPPRVS